METFVQHVKKGKEFAHEARNELREGRDDYEGKLDFGSFRAAKNPQYTGWKPACPPIYYGKVWGTDSSGMTGCLNPYAYWKRVYYRDPSPAELDELGLDPTGVKRSASQPTLGSDGTKQSPSEALMALRKSASMSSGLGSTAKSSGYLSIKENFEDDVLNRFKPQTWREDPNDPLTFENCLKWKYDTNKSAKLRMQQLPKYKYPGQTHTSTKNELTFINSLYHRKDYNCLQPHPLKRIWGDA